MLWVGKQLARGRVRIGVGRAEVQASGIGVALVHLAFAGYRATPSTGISEYHPSPSGTSTTSC